MSQLSVNSIDRIIADGEGTTHAADFQPIMQVSLIAYMLYIIYLVDACLYMVLMHLTLIYNVSVYCTVLYCTASKSSASRC
jgi:hypothetical protein